MNLNHETDVECNGALFIENTNKFPPEELAKYAGRYVAWNFEGTKILASGDDYDELYANLAAAGIKLSTVVQSYVPGPEEGTLLS
jgi:hypothetical protein